MSQAAHIEQLIQEAIGHEADPNQAFFAWMALLAEQLRFPLTAVWWDETFTITGIDLIESSHSHGLKMTTPAMSDPLPYHELTFVSLEDDNVNWLAAFDSWLSDFL
ncbi:MAG: hypothetical protein AAF614_33010 [Chloroflexota bacterium]